MRNIQSGKMKGTHKESKKTKRDTLKVDTKRKRIAMRLRDESWGQIV